MHLLRTFRAGLVLLAFLSALLLSGCAAGGRRSSTLVMTSDAFNMFNGEYEVLPAMKSHTPRSIAVLPFTGNAIQWKSAPDDYSPTDLVRRGMYNHVASLPFSDQEMHETDRLLANAGLNVESAYALLASDPKQLRSVLGVDAVLTGQVTAFDRFFMGIVSQVAVGCEVQLTDLASGKLLWRAKHLSREFGGGVAISPIGLAISTIASAWNIRDEQYDRKTDDLFREIVQSLEQSLPKSLQRRIPPPPRLDFFTVTSQGDYFRAGNEIRFRIAGAPDCEAYVDLPGYKTGIALLPLPEELKASGFKPALESIKTRMNAAGSPLTPEQEQEVIRTLQSRAVYEGAITVAPDDLALNILPRGYIINPAGGIASAFAGTRLINIDAKPPMAPLGLRATPLNEAAELGWKASPTPDVRQYDVYMAAGDTVEYSRIHTSGDLSMTVSGLANFTPVRFYVVAVDAAGNASVPTQIQRVVPVPDKALAKARLADQQLGGIIKEPVRLTADRSPYTVQRPITVVEGGLLFMEPGVTLRFSPATGIAFEGGAMRAHGSKTHPVRFVPASDTAASGSWSGLTIRNNATIHLQYVEINRPMTGLTISDSTAELRYTSIRNAAQAGVYVRENARVTVSCSHITDCNGMGGIVTEGKGAALSIHGSIIEKNSPFNMQNFSPLTPDASGNYWPSGINVLGDIVTEPPLSEAPQSEAPPCE